MQIGQLTALADGIKKYITDIRNDLTTQETTRSDNNRKKEQLKNITKCDGLIPSEVREWQEQVEMGLKFLINVNGAPAYLSSFSTTGSLRREIEHFLSTQANRDIVTWQQIKAHVTTAFISANETERLKGELEAMRQASDEGITLFNRRFRELARKSYPVPRTPDGE